MVLVATHILAKDKLRVRFPLPAPEQKIDYVIGMSHKVPR
jgi:hypothetical protein